MNMDAADIISLVSCSNSIYRLTLSLVANCRTILQAFHQVKIEQYITSESLTELQILLLNMVVLKQNLLLYSLSLLRLFQKLWACLVSNSNKQPKQYFSSAHIFRIFKQHYQHNITKRAIRFWIIFRYLFLKKKKYIYIYISSPWLKLRLHLTLD